MKFREGFAPDVDEVAHRGAVRGYHMLRESLTISCSEKQTVWRFAMVAFERSRAVSPAHIADALSHDANITSFSITPVRQ